MVGHTGDLLHVLVFGLVFLFVYLRVWQNESLNCRFVINELEIIRFKIAWQQNVFKHLTILLQINADKNVPVA